MSMSKYAKVTDYCEAMGYDAGKNGSNEKNCHFSLFSTPEKTVAWEKGKRRADDEKESNGSTSTGSAEALSACEHCWSMSRLTGLEYHDQLALAERDNLPCTRDTIQGAKLRAGQFWDEAAQKDRRDISSTPAEGT